MGRPERKIDPDGGPLQRFALELRELRVAAGRPSYRQLSRRVHFSVTALSEAAGGEVVPTLAVTLAYVEACGGDRQTWEARWRRLMAELASETPHEEEDDSAAPYLGLATFEPSDAERFFGRERLVEELCRRVAEWPFLAVFAPSGAGKSSLLRAGLLPAIAAGAVRGGQDWVTVLVTPGPHPIGELAIRLANLRNIAARSLLADLTADPAGIRLAVRQVLSDRARTAHLVIVVDQFEEVFTLCHDDGERSAFIDMLVAAAGEPRARVVLGVRADFYARCAAYPALVAALRDRQVLVGPMDDDDLRRVITGPAKRAELKVEQGLVEVAVVDTRGQPGGLPLLSHALLETWRRRQGAMLTLAGYRSVGGVRGAIAQTAERVYEEFSAAQRRVAREVFLRLTAFGEGTEDTRRRVTRLELLDVPHGQAVAAVLSRLTAARLITSDENSVTVAHEALIRGWPRLRSWLAEDRELLNAHRRLTEAALEWDDQGREDGLLYRGTRLAGWEGRDLDRLNNLEHAFLAASGRRDARERTAGRRRARFAVTGLAVTVAVVSLLASISLVQANRADAERDLALSRQLVAEARSQLQLDPEQALLLARRAYIIRPTVEAEMVLRQAVVDYREHAVVKVGSQQALGVGFSPDGKRLAGSGVDGTVRMWAWTGDGVEGDPVVLRGHRDQAWTPVFSPDGRRLAAAGLDGTIRIWDVHGAGEPVVLSGHDGGVWGAAFSPDGRHLASAGGDGTVRIWNAHRRDAAPIVLRQRQPAQAVAFSPDGRRVASGGDDHTVRLWDVAGRSGPTIVSGPDRPVKSVAFSADGKWLAGASTDGTARVWPATGEGAPMVLRGHQGTVEGLAFSPDGRWLATAGDDRTVRVWNPTGGGDPLVLRGHKGTVWAVAFSPDGSRLASAAGDGTIRVWDPRGAGDPMLLRGHDGPVWAAAYSPDGERVVSGGADATVRVWKPNQPAAPLVLRGHDKEVLGLDVSSDGRLIASASRDGTIRVWDTTRARDAVVLRGHEGPVWKAAFSPDGRQIASAGRDGMLRIWAAAGDRPPLVRRADDVQQIRYAAFSPNGRQVATGGADGTVRIWDTNGAADPVVLRGHTRMVWAVAFSPDGHSVASAGSDGTVRIWSIAQRRSPLILRGHQGFAWNVTYSPDGRWIASTGKDGTARIWKATEPGQPITFHGFGASVEHIAFGRDGQGLVTTHDDGTVRIWRCQACGPIEQVLALARR